MYRGDNAGFTHGWPYVPRPCSSPHPPPRTSIYAPIQSTHRSLSSPFLLQAAARRQSGSLALAYNLSVLAGVVVLLAEAQVLHHT